MTSQLLKWTLSFCIIIANSFSILSQTDSYADHIGTKDGLSQGAIFDILQDSDGFLWLGTKDGLNRYDGYHFKVFTNDPDDPWSISGNTINRLFEDSKGRIWATVDNNGIDIYDKKTGRFHHIQYDPLNPAGLSGNHIATIVEDTSGYFLVNVDEKEINMFTLEDEFFKNHQSPQVIRIQMPGITEGDKAPTTLLKGIAKDSKNRIWVGGQDAIFQLDVQKAKLRLATTGFSIGASQNNPDGSIWAAGHFTPLFHWNGEKAIRVPGQFDAVHHLRMDERNNLWAIRADSVFGLDLKERPANESSISFRKNIFFEWSPPLINAEYPLLSLEIDNSGLIWVGSNGYGLYRINPNQTRIKHLFHNISIRQICVVSNDEYFLNSYSGWYKEDGSAKVFDPLENAENEEDVDVVFISQLGEYWIRQFDSQKNSFLLKRYNPLTKEAKFLEIPWQQGNSQPIIEAKDGLVWMAGFNKILTAIDPATDQVFSFHLESGKSISVDNEEEKLLSREFSTALYEDNRGNIWVGTENGIFKCEKSSDLKMNLHVNHIKNVSGDKNSLSYNHVMCFLDDPTEPEKYIWVCTKGGGLNRMSKSSGEFNRLTKEDGLPDDVIYGILPDRKGNIWGSTNQGIFCLLKAKNENEPFSFRNFSQKDGLQGEEFNTGAYAKMPDGRLMFGGINGLNIFDPQEVLSEDFMPPVQITNLLVGNQPIYPGDKTGLLENTIETTDQITLNYKQDILTIQFASLDFSAPERNKYRYQLVGVDDSWVEADNQRSATFLHLQPKDYIFRVQGTNGHGVWSDHIAELKIKVLPPWWNSWFSYFIYAALFVAAIFMYMRFSINRAKLNQQLSFEKREADRIRELDAQKTQLYMNMTHEFRTPLTIILGMAKQLKEKPNGQLESAANMIIRNGQNLLGLVNKMLSLSKLESGKMKLDLIQDDVILFLKNLAFSFDSLVEQKEIQLHFLPEIDTLITFYDPDKLQQIISNLISNAYKFTPEDGNIYLIVKVENDSLIIRVKDTGKGVSETELENIFDRFYQADNSTTRQYEGTGIGLALTKELVTLMGGKISAQSPPAGVSKGTEFIIHLPLGTELGVQLNTNAYINKFDKKPLVDIFQHSKTPPSKIETNVKKQKVGKITSLEKEHKLDQKQPLILLVEDNADVVAYVAACIRNEGTDNQKNSNGYRLAVAENGQEGLELAIEMIPDLIISDVMMPIMDGFELCRQLKSDARTNHIPIIILTARADMSSKIEGLEIGANAYLPKPFEKQELILTIKNLFSLRESLRNRFQNTFNDSVIIEIDSSMNQEEIESQEEDVFVRKIREIIEANMTDFNFGVGQISDELHLSHSQLARKLDALTGYSPNRFIRLIKLTKAKELLKDNTNSITVIAYDCGFSDPSYFSRVFKKEFGKTPGDWREG